MSYDVGDQWTPQLTVTNAAGVLTAATVTLAVTSPLGVVTSPAVSTPSLGVYTATVPLTSEGRWLAVWTVSGAVSGVERQAVDVAALNQVLTLAEAKTYMGVKTSEHDAEISRYITQAAGVVQSLAGPAIRRATFVERHSGSALLLHRYPVVSITSISSVNSGVLTPVTGDLSLYIDNATTGSVRSPYTSGTVEVTYVAGPTSPPAEVLDAALVWVSYKYRRNHGGSETYMPAGVDGGISPPMGTRALHDQMRVALGEYAAGSRVA